ncbi:GRAM domain-containing protein [Tenacibaculum soleae]|uniref:GRAM domain-containing protein n=1 Tax=Tenacibaculum soleae TaxID=447689 RepID=UPI0026E11A90|nr:GRAM domain-containing protein [Tenacibaculum soleae]MDO6744587.1 GRAM domain-containing protein [Tenacibaculum soleae]
MIEIGTKMMKMNLKQKIIFIIITTILYTLILWFFDYIWNENNSITSLIIQGLFFGIIFGIGYPYSNKKLASTFYTKATTNLNFQLEKGEQIEIHGPGNLFKGFEAIGGKIILTNKRIVFKSHNINIQKINVAIDYLDIKQIIKTKTIKFIDNGIKITTKDHKEYNFVVNERDLWFSKIKERLN